MADVKPWEKYAAQPAPAAEEGPWAKYAAADVPLVDQIPTGNTAPPLKSQPAAKPAPDGILAKVGGVLEAPLSMATAIPAGVVGNVAGLFSGLTSGKFGTQEGVKIAENRAHEVSNALTYQPRTQTGNKLLQTVGDVVNASGIVGVPAMELARLSSTMVPAKNALADLSKAGAARAGEAVADGVNKLMPAKQSTMAGVGAAMTDEALMRTQRAADLPVPIKLTKGQADRTYEQQKFERETAKLPEGEPLRQRFADQNEKVIQNFDAWMDDTGMQSPNLRSVGEAVTGAIGAKKAKVKAQIQAAYDQAEQAGHMSQPVDVSGILKYVEENRPASLNAPVLNSIEQGLKKLDPNGTGLVSIKDLEELRKMTGRLSQPGTPNAVYGGEVKALIDAATEGQGGELYKRARSMYAGYANEFKSQAVIDKLLRNKPGTRDRAVAYEDVFQHSVLRGSLDDVQAVRKTLETAGPAGEQAWRELQGQTIGHIKDEITKNVARDIRGNPVVSPAQLDKLVRGLDADGKLDFIFGKKGAQQIRDVNDLAKDIYTSPPGSVNTSNTASVLIGLLDTAVSGSAGMPLPIGTALNYGIKKAKSNALTKKVDAALNPLTDPKP